MLSARDRQQALNNGISGFDFTVFAKFRDFSDQLKSKSTPIVVAPASFQKDHPDYSPIMGFSGKEGKQFKYQLLSLSDKWKPGSLNECKIGLVEEVDRDQLKDLVTSLIKANCKLIKSVSKPEDLFPLLVFKSADLILISPENHELLKEKFTAQVFKIDESKPIDNPMVFVKAGVASTDVVKSFAGLPADAIKTLGFTGLEPIGKTP